MKPIIAILISIVLITLSACGGNQSSVEGVLLDWDNKPITNVTVIATQRQPIKGYEVFETTTNSDGTFRVKGLYPSSQYLLTIQSNKWKCYTKERIESAPENETRILPNPIKISKVFTSNSPELIADINSGKAARSSVEGSLVDWKNQPVSGVRIVATKKRPVEGYEKYQKNITNEDGKFRLDNLLVDSTYTLRPVSDKWTSNTYIRVHTPHYQGNVESLSKPIHIDKVFTKREPELIADINSGKAARSIVEGSLVDWNNQPVPGIKIVATKKNPVAGYENIQEVITDSDGIFLLDKLLVDSIYKLHPVSDKWSTESHMKIKSPNRPRKRASLSKPIIIYQALVKGTCSLVRDLASGDIRFSITSDKVIVDSQTSLEWIEGPDKDMSFANSQRWLSNCKVAGGGWRMPTTHELKSLSQPGVEKCVGKRKHQRGEDVHLDPAFFKTTGFFMWAQSPPNKHNYAKQFNFNQDREWKSRKDGSFGQRIFGVREN